MKIPFTVQRYHNYIITERKSAVTKKNAFLAFECFVVVVFLILFIYHWRISVAAGDALSVHIFHFDTVSGKLAK